jgi:hypothetical protein
MIAYRHVAAGLDTNETEETLCEYLHPDEEDYAPVEGDSVILH